MDRLCCEKLMLLRQVHNHRPADEHGRDACREQTSDAPDSGGRVARTDVYRFVGFPFVDGVDDTQYLDLEDESRRLRLPLKRFVLVREGWPRRLHLSFISSLMFRTECSADWALVETAAPTEEMAQS